MKRQTLVVLLIHIEECEMITARYSKLGLRGSGISFELLIMRANPDVLRLKKCSFIMVETTNVR